MKWWQIILYFVLCTVVVLLAYYTTYLYAGNAKKYNKCKYLSIVDSLRLGPDKTLHIVKAGNEYVLISVCGKNLVFLATLDEKAFLNQVTEQNPVEPLNFSMILRKVINRADVKKHE